MLLLGVSVSTDQIGGSGFRARTGEQVSVGLSLFCRRRTLGGDGGEGLAGLVVPAVRDSFYGGWVLDADGIPFHVTEESAQTEVAFIAETRARAGTTRVRVEGTVSLADDHVVDEVRDRWDLDLNRTWLVRRIVRLTGALHEPVEAIVDGRDGSGYLLDLESTLS